MRGVALALVLAVGAGCNSLLGIDDLTLVDAMPVDAQSTYELREGVAGYASTKDTFITDAEATTPHGADPDLRWTTTNNTHGLLRFDDIFGSTGIPSGRTVVTATLDVWVLEAGSPDGQLYESLVDWDEATTYNTLGPTPGVLPVEDRSFQVPGTIDGSALGMLSINVTQSLRRWAMDPAVNRGWIFVPADGALVRIASSEDTDVSRRPRLTVQLAP